VRGGEDFKKVRKESQFYPNKLHSPLKYKTLYEEEEENPEDACSYTGITNLGRPSYREFHRGTKLLTGTVPLQIHRIR
jgi:hypothetical protein